MEIWIKNEQAGFRLIYHSQEIIPYHIEDIYIGQGLLPLTCLSKLSITEIIALSLVVIMKMRQRFYSQTSRQTISGLQEQYPFYKPMQP